MTITIEVKDVYGNKTVYPACKLSEAFAKLAGKQAVAVKTTNKTNHHFGLFSQPLFPFISCKIRARWPNVYSSEGPGAKR